MPKHTADSKLVATSEANPYTALLRDPSKVDKYYWSEQARAAGAARAQQKAQQRTALAAPAPPFVHNEIEPSGTYGRNDSHATAELITGFGTGKKLNNRVSVHGELSPQQSTPSAVDPAAEDDGSITLAAEFGLGSVRNAYTTTGTIGDGPHGSTGDGSGDFDFSVVHASAGPAAPTRGSG